MDRGARGGREGPFQAQDGPWGPGQVGGMAGCPHTRVAAWPCAGSLGLGCGTCSVSSPLWGQRSGPSTPIRVLAPLTSSLARPA